MRSTTLKISVVGLVALLAGSCSSAPGSARSVSQSAERLPSTTTAPPKVFSTPELQAMLLTSSEVPSGLSQRSADASSQDNSSPLCGISGAHYLSAPGQSWASVSFDRGDYGAFVVESLDGFSSVTTAQDSLSKTKASLDGCNGRTDAGSGVTATYAVTPEGTNIEGVDDQTAFHIVVDAQILTADAHLVIIRKGTAVSSMMAISLHSPTGDSGVSTTDFSSFVNAAAAKIQ